MIVLSKRMDVRGRGGERRLYRLPPQHSAVGGGVWGGGPRPYRRPPPAQGGGGGGGGVLFTGFPPSKTATMAVSDVDSAREENSMEVCVLFLQSFSCWLSSS